MTIKKSRSLRKCIDENCRNCIYDKQAAGTWLQQVTLCSVTSCSIYPVRPVTKAAIPESVLNYYSVTGPERDRYALKNTRKGPFTEHKSNGQYLTTAEHESVAS